MEKNVLMKWGLHPMNGAAAPKHQNNEEITAIAHCQSSAAAQWARRPRQSQRARAMGAAPTPVQQY